MSGYNKDVIVVDSANRFVEGWSFPALCLIVLAFVSPAFGEEAKEAERETQDTTETTIYTPGIDRALHIMEFDAPSVGRRMKYIAMLPEGYDDPENAERLYPVLYLLHGFSQNYTVWPRMGAPFYTEDYELILVMPDAGNTWYVNWAESDGDEKNNWEDFIIADLIPNVDAVFRTITHRGGRAINGVSMGGFGALALGLRHPGLFCSIASHSGALGFARNARLRLEAGEKPNRSVKPQAAADDRDAQVPDVIGIPGFTLQWERYPNGIAFKTVEQCKAYDPFELILQIPVRVLPHIYIDCGMEDNLLSVAQEFAKLLIDIGVPFTYAQTPGQHGVRYWTRESEQSIAVQYNIIRRNIDRAPPVPDPLAP